MSDYKRLTKKSWHDCKFAQLNPREVLYKLWQLENKIENGTLIELPYLHHHKEDINGLNYEFWQVVFNYKGTILKTKVIYDKAEAEAELAKIRVQE